MFPSAPQAPVIRAFQKDQHYLADLTDEVRTALELAVGRVSARLKDEIEACARALYYCSGSVTLGEEFADLLPVQHAEDGRPVRVTWRTRALLACCHVLAPYALAKLRRAGHVEVADGSSWSWFAWVWNSAAFAAARSGPAVRRLSQLHLGLFYLNGAYLELSKRVARVRYVALRKLEVEHLEYRVLGVLIGLQLAAEAAMALREHWRSFFPSGRHGPSGHGASRAPPSCGEDEDVGGNVRSNSPDSAGDLSDESADHPTCMLCLSPRRDTTATDCGHLFCWECICEGLTMKPECPYCRQGARLQDLVRLAQYR